MRRANVLPRLAWLRGRVVVILLAGAALALIMSAAGAPPAGARRPHHKPGSAHRHGSQGSLPSLSAHGQLVHVAPKTSLQTNQSNNWFGYDQGTLERGGKLFTSISARWTVPRATRHTARQAEASSDWIGIGGGCVDASCLITDNTLIQAGTEQDVNSTGKASYYAWWEVIPAPSLQIPKMKVVPGDRMSAKIAEVVPDSDLWRITVRDRTRRESYSTTVPYISTHLTAEWIEETPLEINANPGLAALPKLSQPNFDLATVNGASAHLKRAEEMRLIDPSGKAIGTPSAPDSDSDGFGACAWSGSCVAPPS